jgi:sigma-E factor negative regulatory protein RseB
MTRRPGLLLSAALTVTVPGVLAVLAVLGHDHAIGDAPVAAPVGDTVALSGPFPVASAKTHTAVRNAVAWVQRVSGVPVTVLSSLTSGQEALGIRLLGRAAEAGQAISYQGVETMSDSGVDGTVSAVSEVWHQGGGQTLVQSGSAVFDDDDGGTPEGVFGLTSGLVAQLGKHYVAAYAGTGSTHGRTALIVAVYRFDGSLAARYWLDRQTLVPLRRELYDTSDRVVSEDAFVSVRFGAVPARPAAATPAETAAAGQQTGPAWVAAASPARVIATLSAEGWRLPEALPGGLPLYAAAWRGTGAGQLVDLEYSDGLYVVSLFLQHGALAARMPGWQPVLLDGREVFVSGHSVAWAGSGGIYTLIADAPPQTVTQAVAALPRDVPPGVFARLGRGLERIAQLANPFS